MASTPSIQVIKQINWRGGLRNFSNRYHFNGGTPADSAHWTTFSDAVVALEKQIYPAIGSGGATIVYTKGYAAGSEVPVFQKSYATAGLLSSVGFVPTPSDVAALIRYSTASRTSKNHPLYLFNYYHAVGCAGGATTSDTFWTTQKTAFGTYATAWIAGVSDGTNTYVRSGPNGQAATGQVVNALLTHRDLPRG